MERLTVGTPQEVISQTDKPAARVQDKRMGASLHLYAGCIATMAYSTGTGGRITASDAPETNEETLRVCHETYSCHYPDKVMYDCTYYISVSYTHLRAHETRHDLVC